MGETRKYRLVRPSRITCERDNLWRFQRISSNFYQWCILTKFRTSSITSDLSLLFKVMAWVDLGEHSEMTLHACECDYLWRFQLISLIPNSYQLCVLTVSRTNSITSDLDLLFSYASLPYIISDSSLTGNLELKHFKVISNNCKTKLHDCEHDNFNNAYLATRRVVARYRHHVFNNCGRNVSGFSDFAKRLQQI